MGVGVGQRETLPSICTAILLVRYSPIFLWTRTMRQDRICGQFHVIETNQPAQNLVNHHSLYEARGKREGG